MKQKLDIRRTLYESGVDDFSMNGINRAVFS